MMLLLFYTSIGAVLLVTALDVWAGLVLRVKKEPAAPLPHVLPQVAVLLPVRNEEEHLPGCLQSLLALDYPPEKLLILVGNDASTDKTLAIAEQWQQENPQIKVYTIENTLGQARGKANVLAQLVHQCPAVIEHLFMTDADIRPHPQWIRRMLPALKPGIGLVNGTTRVAGKQLWARWQQTDWAIALGLAKAYTYLPRVGRTLTAIGNNMLMSRTAYKATGGYESFPFSITEDYELMEQLRQQGYKAVQLMDRESSATTEPVLNFGVLMHQRKRWMTGAMRLPLPMIALLVVQALFFPAILLILGIQPFLGLFLLLLKLLAQLLLASTVLSRMGERQLPAAGLLYELYSFFISTTLMMFYILPLKINWKDRTYRGNRN